MVARQRIVPAGPLYTINLKTMQEKHILPRTNGKIEIHLTKRDDGSYIVQGFDVDAGLYIPGGKVYSGHNAYSIAHHHMVGIMTYHHERSINSESVTAPLAL